MPLPVNAIVASSSNQFNITTPLDPSDYTIGLASGSLNFPGNVSVATLLTLNHSILQTGGVYNNFPNLSTPSGTSLLASTPGTSSSAPGNFQWTPNAAQLSVSLECGFTGGSSTWPVAAYYNLFGNQVCVYFQSSDLFLSPADSFYGVTCDADTPTFQATFNQTGANFAYPASLPVGGYLLIGHIPITDTTVGFGQYYLGNVYLYCATVDSNYTLYITLGQESAAITVPNFINGHTYGFGFIDKTFYYATPSDESTVIVKALAANFSYFVA